MHKSYKAKLRQALLRWLFDGKEHGRIIHSGRAPKPSDVFTIGTVWNHGQDKYVAVEINTLWQKVVPYEPSILNCWNGKNLC